VVFLVAELDDQTVGSIAFRPPEELLRAFYDDFVPGASQIRRFSVDPEYQRLFGPAETELAVYTHHHDHAHDVHGDVVPKADTAESSE